jgi:hypothetical protein
MYHIVVGEAGVTLVNHEGTIVECWPGSNAIALALEYVGSDPVEVRSVAG